MEASAFLQACKHTGVQAFGVIKGVSDLGDNNKGVGHDMHYRPALENAADATKAFIKWKLKHISEDEPDISSSTVRPSDSLLM
jgi:nucleoside phosphorylase